MNLAEKADASRHHYRRRLQQIQDDPSLSEAGKQQAIARVYREHRDGMAALAAEHDRAQQAERKRLEDRVFRPPAGTLPSDYRDAIARADTLADEDEALAALSRAERTGDLALAKAITAVALERTWLRVVDAFASERPADADAINRLAELTTEQTNLRPQMFAAMAFAADPQPIGGDVDTIADGPLDNRPRYTDLRGNPVLQ